MHQEIETFIKQFNDSWTKGTFDRLTHLLDNETIFVASDLESEITGKDRCIQTIRDYAHHAETKRFDVTHKKINIWNETAMVVLDYYVEYEMNNQLYKEKGKEFWTLNKQEGKWKLVWRAMVKNEKMK